MIIKNQPTIVKQKRMKDRIIIIVLAFIFVASSGMVLMHFINEALMHWRSRQAREVMHEVFVRPQTGTDGIPQQALVADETYGEPGSRLDFDALREAFGNDDIVAHLYVDGTVINYLVVQTTNNDFYQNHDIWRNRSAAGWVFLDYEVDLGTQDHNIVIYAHNMRREHKFHSMRHFNNFNFFRLHPYIFLTTPYAEYRWEIFSFYSTFIDFNYNIINFPSETARNDKLREFEARSMHNAGVSVNPSDRILTLSTCTNRDRDERYVLHARLVSHY